METYLDRAREGEHSWRSYRSGVGLILFTWQLVGGLIALGIAVALRPPGMSASEAMSSLSEPFKNGAVRGSLELLPLFVCGILGLFLTMRNIHGRPFISLVTPRTAVDPRRVFVGFGLWFGIMGLTSLTRFALAPSAYTVSLDLPRFLPFLAVAVVLIPLQSGFEELFFRGYLMQAASVVTRRAVVLVLTSGLLFMLPHLVNPEVSRDPLIAAIYYFAFGGMLAWWSIRDGTIELALGMHVANNLFGALVLSFQGSVLSTPSIFYTRHFEPRQDLAELVVGGALFTVLVQYLGRRSAAPKPEPVMEARETR